MRRWLAADGGNGHYYQAVAAPNGIRWEAAQVWAADHGGHLATIGSAEENLFVFRLVDDARYWSQPNANYYNGPHIGGLKRSAREGAGEWQWINRDEPFNYVNWAEGQPDNQKDNENRLQFYSTHGLDGRRPTWNDAPATFAARGFVVEYDTDASRAPPAALPTGSEQALTAEQMAGIVLIEGDKGVATGFLAKIRNVEVVVTNLHVIGDNERILVRTLAGNTVTWSGLIGAVGSDVA